MTERAAGQLPRRAEVLELDVNNGEDIERLRAELEQRWGALDGLLHAVAYAPPDALGGGFLDTPLESAVIAYQTSAFSLKALVAGLLPLLEAAPDGAGVVGLDFDASVAWPRMTGWASPRPRSRRSRATSRASSARARSAST